MRKTLTILAVLAMFCFLVVPSVKAAADYTLDNVKFFEKGPGDIPSRDQRVYKTSFPKSTARYITCEVNLINNRYNIRDHTHSITVKYYRPDGSLMGDIHRNFTVKSSWSTSWHTNGWGWKTSGNWPVGTYLVKVWIDSNFVTQSYFTIYDDVVHLRFTNLRFFESGYDNADPPMDLSSSQYRTSFSKSTTRYVNVLVVAENLLYRVRDHSPLIRAKFYNPDGSFLGETKTALPVPSNWDEVDTWLGWGWKTPGNWPLGTYRVEVYFGDSYTTTSYFTITP